uniref:Mediator of RNA polymerase II transcription subunit 25 n=1 Tax=Angiostrongylus cantonensis TaxID=6313 RepID=A0A0K0DGS4_ANGCA
LLSAYPDLSTGCWLSSFHDLPHLSAVPIPAIDCPSSTIVKLAISQIVSKIQNFCNSNSSNPPITRVGVIGGDKFINQILRAYVECLHHKSSSNWLHYLRFAIIPAPHSLMCAIAGLDGDLDQLCHDIWERWVDLSLSERVSVTEKMTTWLTAGGGACINLPIGEALLQMTERGQEVSCRMFVPFLAEVRVAHFFFLPITLHFFMNHLSSPPNSPHIRAADSREMDPSNNVNMLSSQNVTPNSKKDVSKGSIKASFRTLVITRSCSQPLLSLNFVKEKKKEKMLQKLGMKKGQKTENDNPPVQVVAVSRLLCSCASKHADLTVNVDGFTYERIRYFQCSSQWQTHVKSFPVSLIA